MLDTLKRLIVGRRGRARADRLVVTSTDGAQKTVAVKAQKNASTYVDLVEACAPVRIEAYAGDELVAAWGEPPAPARAVRAPKVPKPAPAARKTASTPAPGPPPKRKTRRADWIVIKEVTTHMNTLLASAYKGAAERDVALWGSLAQIAQHHSDRADIAEERTELTNKSVRLRDKAINERDALILRLNAKISEVATATDDDKRTEAFLQLLKVAGAGQSPVAQAVAAASGVNGAAKKPKVS